MTTLTEHDTAKAHLSALVEDWRWYLGDTVSCTLLNDIVDLTDRSRTRGMSILMDTLPSLGKLYELSLECGFFDSSKVPKVLARRGSPYIFERLINLSFFPEGMLRGDPDAETVQLTRSFLYLFKKVKKDSSDAAKSLAIADFYSVEVGIPEIHPFWLGGDWERIGFYGLDNHVPRTTSDRLLLAWMGIVCRQLIKYDGCFADDLFRVLPKHGPGSVSDLPSGGDKYRFPNWPRDLSRVFPPNGWASHVHDCAVDSLPEWWGDHEVCSKLICVPKTLSKPRVIASEPTAKQYCQQALMVLLRKMVSRSPLARIIDFNSQERSRELLRRHSDVATIDLSSASDRLSANLVLAAFGHLPEVLDALRASRTKWCWLPEPVNVCLLLNKFAPMGSAVTFPVQSIIYGCAVVAALLYEELGKPTSLNSSKREILRVLDMFCDRIQVFGDDIICPEHTRLSVEVLLEDLGLRVNRDKSFSHDFKESCGLDVYKRHEVTPLYLGILTPTVRRQEVASIVEVSNNAYLKGYWNLARSIEQQVPEKLRPFIPVSSQPLPSLRYISFQSGTIYRTRARKWDANLHLWKVKAFVPRSSSDRVCRNSWSDLLQYFIEAPKGERSPFDEPTLHSVGWADCCRTSYDVRWVREV